jgi:tetratricopeptide (TPR) repeat protein
LVGALALVLSAIPSGAGAQQAPAANAPARPAVPSAGNVCFEGANAPHSTVIAACNTVLGAPRSYSTEQIAQALRRRAETLAAGGRLEEAISDFREMIKRGYTPAQAHTAIAEIRSRQGRQDDAETSFREALRLSPSLATARSGLGLVLLTLSRPAEAVAELRQAVTAAPNLAVAHLGLGMALHASGDVEQAIASYAAAIRLEPRNVVAHQQRARAHVERSDFTAARADADVLVELSTGIERARALLYRGRVRHAARDRDGSLDDCREAERLAAREPRLAAEAAVCVGLSYVGRGDLRAAREAYERAATTDPSSSDAITGRGYVAFQRGRYAEAVTDFEAALRLQPSATDALRFLGLAYAEGGQLSQALDAFQKAIAADANDPWPLMLRATALARAGRREQALADAEAALGLAGAGASDALLARAGVHYFLEDLDAARRDLEASLRSNAQNGQAHVMLARLSIRQGRHAEAETALQAAQRFIPYDPSVALNLGLLALARGEPAVAVRELGRSLDANAAHAEGYAARGQAYEALGQRDLAAADYRTAAVRLALDGDGRRAQALAAQRLAALTNPAPEPLASAPREAAPSPPAGDGVQGTAEARSADPAPTATVRDNALCRMLEGLLVHSRKYSGVDLEVGCRY